MNPPGVTKTPKNVTITALAEDTRSRHEGHSPTLKTWQIENPIFRTAIEATLQG